MYTHGNASCRAEALQILSVVLASGAHDAWDEVCTKVDLDLAPLDALVSHRSVACHRSCHAERALARGIAPDEVNAVTKPAILPSEGADEFRVLQWNLLQY